MISLWIGDCLFSYDAFSVSSVWKNVSDFFNVWSEMLRFGLGRQLQSHSTNSSHLYDWYATTKRRFFFFKEQVKTVDSFRAIQQTLHIYMTGILPQKGDFFF